MTRRGGANIPRSLEPQPGQESRTIALAVLPVLMSVILTYCTGSMSISAVSVEEYVTADLAAVRTPGIGVCGEGNNEIAVLIPLAAVTQSDVEIGSL